MGVVPERSGNRWDISAPRNTYQTADGRWLAMSGSSPALALRVFRAIGRDDLVTDPDFSDAQRRLARAREVDAVVADWVATKTLSEAMAQHPRAFDRLYVNMVRAGETGGVLDVILQRLAEFMEKAQRLRRKIIGAMIYPTVVISFSLLIVMGIMVV